MFDMYAAARPCLSAVCNSDGDACMLHYAWCEGRVLETAWPVRFVGFFGTPAVAVAAGGDYNSGVGGIYTSHNNGVTWELEIDTGVEMSACSGTARDYGGGGGRDRAGGASMSGGGGGGGSVYVTCVGSAKGKTSVVVSQSFTIGEETAA